ncbi:MAG TPA: twin-arginine translocase subunit TatC, partial [Ilumatobacteraceae bacterium]|nr:twin-arginine translocase subunit TatC [Ilumatobacteraceae bacterium]
MKLSLKREKRAKVASPEDRMTLTEHLAELRTRIIRALLAMVLGITIVMAAYGPVLRFLTQPYVDLCARRGPEFCVADLQ